MVPWKAISWDHCPFWDSCRAACSSQGGLLWDHLVSRCHVSTICEWHIPVWISPMGSRPSFCTKVSKFLTSAIIKWWFSTSRGLRKMTTWYCYKMKIGFYHQVTWRGHSTTTKWRLYFLCVFIIRLLEGNTSEGQLPLLQNEIGFLHVVFRWANSLATKWLSIFKGLSTTETLKTYKMQFPSCGYKMPGPSPFFHLNLSPEMPLKRGTRPPIL